MLGKLHRLPKDIDFGRAGTVSSQAFLIKTRDNAENNSRFGIVVSKKTEKTAVGRNKIKRQIRSFIQRSLKEIKKGRDVLIIVKKEARNKNSEEISVLLYNLFKKQNLI